MISNRGKLLGNVGSNLSAIRNRFEKWEEENGESNNCFRNHSGI